MTPYSPTVRVNPKPLPLTMPDRLFQFHTVLPASGRNYMVKVLRGRPSLPPVGFDRAQGTEPVPVLLAVGRRTAACGALALVLP